METTGRLLLICYALLFYRLLMTLFSPLMPSFQIKFNFPTSPATETETSSSPQQFYLNFVPTSNGDAPPPQTDTTMQPDAIVAPAVYDERRLRKFFRMERQPMSDSAVPPSTNAVDIDISLLDSIARRVLPQVESDLKAEELNGIRSQQFTFNNATGRVWSGTSADRTRTTPPSAADDGTAASSNTDHHNKLPYELGRLFAKPTRQSTQLMRISIAMEIVTLTLKTQLQLSNEVVAMILPTLDIRETALYGLLQSRNANEVEKEKIVVTAVAEPVAAQQKTANNEQIQISLQLSPAPSFFTNPKSDFTRRRRKRRRAKRQLLPQNQPNFLLASPCQRSPFRSMDGSCNNLQNFLWGRSFSPYKRYIVTPHYSDGVSTPRMNSYNANNPWPLPSARLISSVMHNMGPVTLSHDHVTSMLTQWGQFMDHDMTHTPVSAINNNGRLVTPTCCNLPANLRPHRECFPIAIARDDPFFRQFDQNCLEFVRSSPASNRLGPREQLNQITSFLDASMIYGSTPEDARVLRAFRGGELLHNVNEQTLEELLPNDLSSAECVDSTPQIGRVCFKAGDVRSNEQPALTAIHTIFLRLHNQMARTLNNLNRHWPDERVYLETRKTIGALIQHITYNEWLPVVLGRDFIRRYGLQLHPTNYYNGYDAARDPTIANEFAAAAFRFGHTLVQGRMFFMDESHHAVLFQNLVGSFFSPMLLHDNGRCDQAIRGLCNQNIQLFDRHIDDQLTNHLFQTSGQTFGHDLAARNIQRGRDHGLPGYNFYRRWCGLPVARNWNDLRGQMNNDDIERLRSLYDNPSDVDLFTAGISEFSVPGGILGPTLACIVAQQFQDLRMGDRYWYENRGNDVDFVEGFRPDQLQEIRKMSLARIICDTTNTVNIQRNVMLETITQMNINPRLHCTQVPGMDFSFWREVPFNVQQFPPAAAFRDEAKLKQNIITPTNVPQALNRFPPLGATQSALQQLPFSVIDSGHLLRPDFRRVNLQQQRRRQNLRSNSNGLNVTFNVFSHKN